MKKLINVVMASVLGLSVVGVSQASSLPDQGSGTVTFKGRVIDAPCGINPDSTNKVVDFGDLSVHELENGGKIVPFSIKLANCDIVSLKAKAGNSKDAPKNIVKIAFTGAVVDSKPYMLSTSGGTGVGITISTLHGDSYIKMDGTPIPASFFMNGKGEIPLEATAMASSNQGVISGTFTATANFSLSYE